MNEMPRAETIFAELLHEVDVLLPRECEGGGAARAHPAAVAELLGFLARRQTLLEERRYAEMQHFLRWMEGEIGCSIDDLSGKTCVKNYPDEEDAAVLEVLERNHPRRVRPDLAAPREYRARNPERDRIVRGLQESRARIAPIRRELGLAGRLTDLIVYRQYGLTEEQIAVVEETTPPQHPAFQDT